MSADRIYSTTTIWDLVKPGDVVAVALSGLYAVSTVEEIKDRRRDGHAELVVTLKNPDRRRRWVRTITRRPSQLCRLVVPPLWATAVTTEDRTRFVSVADEEKFIR